MPRIARVKIDYRTPEQLKAYIDGNYYAGTSSIMPGETVPEYLVAQIVVGNPDWLEPITETKQAGEVVETVVKKGHGLDEKQLLGLTKLEQLSLLSKCGVKGTELEKLKKLTEKDRVKKLLEFA